MTRDFRQTLAVVSADIKKMLENEPTAINGLLFRANRAAKETLPDMPTDLVGSMEGSEKIIEYLDPVDCYGLEIPFDWDVPMETAGDHANDFSEEPRAMLLSVDPVPKGSVFVYDEYDATSAEGASIVRRMFWVQASRPVSKHPGAGVMHFMMPFLDYDGTFAGEPEPRNLSPSRDALFRN
jgi:hypothetical protein